MEMTCIGEKRAKRDEMELSWYGFCTTQLYVDYRNKIDNKLKFLMVEMANYYENQTKLDKDYVDEMLFKQYQRFWAMAEPYLTTFYEEISSILELPADCFHKEISPKGALCSRETEELEEEINALKVTYEVQTCFLPKLRHRQEVVDTICSSLKDKLEFAMKIKAKMTKNSEHVKKLDKKRSKMDEKILAGVDRKTWSNFFAADIHIDDEKEILDDFMKIRIEV